MDDELLEFNGSSLVCKQIRKCQTYTFPFQVNICVVCLCFVANVNFFNHVAERKCICPEPTSGSGDMTLLPEPPGGMPKHTNVLIIQV